MLDNRDLEAINNPVEETETPTVETEEVETPQESPEIAPEPAKEPDVEANPQEETQPATPAVEYPKPGRAESRIKEVIAERHNLANENAELKAQIANFKTQPAPEMEGDMTYDDLNRTINERAMQAAELIAKGNQVEQEYTGQVKTWATDFEKVKESNPALNPESPDYDPELDATLARLLDDGHGNPRVDILVSDVLKTLNKRESAVTSKAIEKGKSEANATLARQSAEGAITPSNKVSKTEEYTQDEIDNIQQTNNRLYTELVAQGRI